MRIWPLQPRPSSRGDPPRPVCAPARSLWVLVALLLAIPPPAATAQSTISRDILYTRAAGTESVRSVRITYSTDPAPTLSLSTPDEVASPPGADGLCLGPGGDALVAGGTTAPNAVHKVALASGALATVSPGTGASIATSLALDPAADRLWAVCSSGGAGRIARIPLTPFSLGVAHAITGADTSITHLCFAHGRAYYIAPGLSPGAGVLGIIDLNTFTTTRLLTGLDRPRSITLDPFTGHLLVFGAASLVQIDARPGISPVVISIADLSPLAPGLNVRSGTVDGLGHAFALSDTGHLALIDYASTRTVGHAANHRLTAQLDTPGVLRTIAPLVGAGALRQSGCLWDNGAFDLRDGLPSHNTPAAGDTRTADDFYLPPGVHRIDSIGATMFSDSLFLTAVVEVYEDCNGAPGQLLATCPATVTDTGSVFQGLRVLQVAAPTSGLWLRGGRSYWVSAVGVGSLDGSDNWYWGTSGGPEIGDPPGTPNSIRGKPAMFRAPAQGVPDWTPSNDAGCGCTDFAFTVRGVSCKVLHDNGPPQPAEDPAVTGAPSIISSTSSDSRAADNFRIPPCRDRGGETVCFIEATVYTNCSPVRGVAEIFANDCTLPSGPALYSGAISKVIDLGYNVVIGGSTLRAYTAQVHDADWFLPDGRNYWLSVSIQGSGGFSQRAYFAANTARCPAPGCDLHISQAAVRGSGVSLPAWATIENYLQVSRDLSFLIAVAEPLPEQREPEPLPAQHCLADADGNDQVDVSDIFHFLSNWFQGCP